MQPSAAPNHDHPLPSSESDKMTLLARRYSMSMATDLALREIPAVAPALHFEMPHAIWRDLFARIVTGEVAALEAVYEVSARTLYGLALWRTGRREDAADVVQQVFLRLAERRNQLTDVNDPRAWLLSITHRIAVDMCRRRNVRRADSIDAYGFLTAPTHDSDRAIDAERASGHLATLKVKPRTVIYLRHFAGCTFEEIGQILGIPTFTAASRYRNGINKLRQLMEGKP